MSMLEALEHVGATSRYQYFLVLINLLLCCLSGILCFQFQALTIMQPVECLSQRCSILQMAKGSDPELSIMCKLDSNEWKFASGSHINWLTDYALYCDNLFLKSLGTTLYFVGFMIGVTPLSSLCDKHGRRSASMGLLLTYSACVIGTKLTTTLYQAFFFRFALGFLHAGISVIVFTLSSELTTPKFATFINVCGGAGYSFGSTVVSFLADSSQHWQDIFNPLIFVSVLILVVFYFTIPESPQWLFAQKRTPEAIETLNYIASFNGRTALPKDVTFMKTDKPSSANPVSMILSNNTLYGCIKKLSFCWFTVSICYYALQFNAGGLGDDEYTVMKYMGLLDIPIRFLILFVANTWGRRKACLMFFSICTSSLVFCLIPWIYTIEIGALTLKSIMVLVGHGSGAAIFSLMYSYTSEVLPTLARSTGVSMCSAIARIASLLSPFVILLNQVSPSLIFLLAAMCTLMSMNLVRQLPETLNKPLPANIDDCEIMFRRNRKLEQV